MTLTEQYKKERSITENKDYYVVDNKGCSFIDFFWGDGWLKTPVDDIEEVLAPVPSYEEWQKVLNIDFNNEVLRLENAKLKELLKECQHMILAYSINNNTFTKEEVIDIVKQIDNAIGEKK